MHYSLDRKLMRSQSLKTIGMALEVEYEEDSSSREV
jgi:hypothetical protein